MQIKLARMVQISNGLSAEDTSDVEVAKNRIVKFCDIDDVEMDSLEFDSIINNSATAPLPTSVINSLARASTVEKLIGNFPASRPRRRPRTESAWTSATLAFRRSQKSCFSLRV